MKRLTLLALFTIALAVHSSAAEELTVMTRNLYFGGSLDAALGAGSIAEIPEIVSATWASIQASNFPDRARALAAEIAADEPHLVGLQEVWMFRLQSPGDFLTGNAEAATEVELDFLQLLETELAAQGLDYRVVATVQNADVEVPAANGDDIRLTDREVILARADVEVTNGQGANYALNLELPIGGAEGLPVTFLRGWVSVDAKVGERTVRFFSTHLERKAAAAIQEIQADELVQLADGSPHPVVLVGDLNSAADGSGTSSYGDIIDAGYADAWNMAHPGDAGYTCCHANDLQNGAVDFNRRIDHVFAEGSLTVMEANIVGADPAGRTPAGLWPSDHAGMVARLDLSPTVIEARSWGRVKSRLMEIE